jgi:hypothetical protein
MVSSNTEEVPEPISQHRQLVKSVIEDRKKIIEECRDSIRDLESARDKKLAENLRYLLEMGVKETDIPHAQLGTGRKFRKLEVNLIKEILMGYMNGGDWYPSTPIIELLQISYPDFRDFVKANPDFIEKQGINKGTRYKLINMI